MDTYTEKLLQSEKKKLTYKRCFHMQINEEERKLEITWFSVYFSAIKIDHILQELLQKQAFYLIYRNKILNINLGHFFIPKNV